jgi:alkaline phosphatase D
LRALPSFSMSSSDPTTRRAWLQQSAVLGLLPALSAPASTPWAAENASASPDLHKPPGIWRVAFGSCAKQSKPQPIWQRIQQSQPDLFVFLGDNFYADVQTEVGLRERHREFQNKAELQTFRQQVPHVAIWDDHDYGDDDTGAEYPLKRLSQQLFCDSWGEAADSPRRTRDGIFECYRYDVKGKTVQLILPDLRFNRGPLIADEGARGDYPRWVEAALVRARRGEEVEGWYQPQPDRSAPLLGEAQWAWLEAQLREPADLRILGSSIQLAAEGTGWECWSHFPHERQRLLDLLQQHRVSGVVTLSGDMHYGELSRLDRPGHYPLWDITSSGLTEVWPVPTPNRRRVGKSFADLNFGLLDFDPVQLTLDLSVHDLRGERRLHQRLRLSDLQAAT